MQKVLFVCSRNKLRSPTAEAVFADIPGFEVASAGLNRDAVTPLTPELVEWADTIFVMEPIHRAKLQQLFRRQLKKQRVVSLDIPDRFDYMDPELIALLRHRLSNFFGLK